MLSIISKQDTYIIQDPKVHGPKADTICDLQRVPLPINSCDPN